MDELQVEIEQVDDLPLLAAMLTSMRVADVLDRVFPRHGNWRGLSLGKLAEGWLMYILSESDHRMNQVEAWAERHQQTLSWVLGEKVSSKDFTDDRLGALLTYLGKDDLWEEAEDAFNQHHLRVFALPTEVVRLDSTTVAVYHDVEGHTLIGYGHSKDHRPDLAQIKTFVAALDPLALPVVTQPLAGRLSDDPLYVPAIDRVRASLGQRGWLYVGDTKMEKLATRAHIVQGHEYYVLPLSKKHHQGTLLQDYVRQALREEADLEVLTSDESSWRLRGRVWEREQRYQDGDKEVTWRERVMVVQSRTLYEKQRRSLEQRLAKAETELRQLTPPPKRGRRQFRELAPLQERVERILRKHQVSEFLEVHYDEETIERKHRTPRKHYRVAVTRREEVLQAYFPTLGWRLYVTNAPSERLSMAEAMALYRGAVPTIEHLFARLKGRTLGLRPLYLRREDRIKGLVRLLSIALRALTLIEFVVRHALEEEQEVLTGLYPGSPTKATARPTAERLLQAFKGIYLTHIVLPDQPIQHISPLSPLQNRILQLLKFSSSIYTGLAHHEPLPP